MRNLKVFVIGLFLACLGFFFAPRLISPAAFSQSSIGAPSGVSASDGDYATKIGVTWNAVQGATTYQIFRHTTNDPAGAAVVGTTAAPFFFDVTPVVGQQYFYWVKSIDAGGTGTFSQSDTGIRANGVQQGPVSSDSQGAEMN